MIALVAVALPSPSSAFAILIIHNGIEKRAGLCCCIFRWVDFCMRRVAFEGVTGSMSIRTGTNSRAGQAEGKVS